VRLSQQCAEKLIHVLTAAAFYGGARLAGVIDPAGALEAVVGLTGIGTVLYREHAEKSEQVIRRFMGQVTRSSNALLESAEWRAIPDAKQQRDEAIAAFDRIIPLILPSPEEIVQQTLDRNRMVTLLLTRAAEHEECFDRNKGNPLARQLFEAIVSCAFDVIRRDPEIQTHVFEATLKKLGFIEDRLHEIVAAINLPSTNHRSSTESVHKEIMTWINNVRDRFSPGSQVVRGHVLLALLESAQVQEELANADVNTNELAETLRQMLGRLHLRNIDDSEWMTDNVRRVCRRAVDLAKFFKNKNAEVLVWSALTEETSRLLGLSQKSLTHSDRVWVKMIRDCTNLESALRNETPHVPR
jgi:hypothetical protein